MDGKRKIEVFTAGCPCCDDAVQLINRIACSSCEVEVLDMHQADVADRAKRYGVKSVPAVVIDGRLTQCCENSGPDERALREAGLGVAL